MAKLRPDASRDAEQSQQGLPRGKDENLFRKEKVFEHKPKLRNINGELGKLQIFC